STLGTATHHLERPSARRYVRLTQVIAGLRDGFAEAKRPLRSLHALGLGAAVLFPLYAAAAPAQAELATDATSPIHDAVRDRVLYDLHHHGARRSLIRIAEHLLNGDDWRCPCPFCSAFKSTHGHAPEEARAAWQQAGRPAVDRALLDDMAGLATAIPLLAGRDPERHASRTHIAHNHWVLGALARETPQGAGRGEWALARMQALRSGASLTVDRGLEAGLAMLARLAQARPPPTPEQPGHEVVMTTLTLTDLTHTLATAARDGALRVKLIAHTESALRRQEASLRERHAAIASAWAEGPGALRDAFAALFRAGERLPMLHDLIGTTLAVQRRTEAARDEVVQALHELAAIGRVEGMASVVTPEMAERLARQPAQARLSLHAAVLLGLPRRPPGRDSLERRLADWARQRLWALHGLVLLAIVEAPPQSRPDATARLAADRGAVEGRVRELRDALRALASECQASGVVRPRDALALWVRVQETEHWTRDTGSALAAQAGAVATAAVVAAERDALRLARDAALIYDGIRYLLGLLAGAHAVIRAYTLADEVALAAFGAIAALPLAPATLDLPRTSVAQALKGQAGEVIETAALVLAVSVTAGGPAPRTVLIIGTPSGAQLTVLLPFIAADSFGVTSGIWVQVRGTLFPKGKGALKGAVLEVRRIRREAASAASAFDALIWLGRREFTLRPGQLDIVAGRCAGRPSAALELALRRQGG
ncbi:hypothetical protein, partial [Halomonas sp. BM-2019]|uniref:hypothetical protein n=1 Tax=Halomonas sp. BM-2019 TaxID=2811227 RepID=UPI001B3C1C8C